MPTIAISDATFRKLQALAVPFVDDPESVIAKLAEQELDRRGSKNGVGPAVPGPAVGPRRLHADRPDDLSHTRVLGARIDGQDVARPNWQKVMTQMHVLAASRLGSYEAVRKATSANVQQGQYEERGFRYLPEAGMSVQSQDANRAWQHSLRLARAIGVPLRVRVEWRDKEEAAHPGELAEIEWAPVGAEVAAETNFAGGNGA